MAIDVNKLIITEVAQITAFNNAGELEFILDEIQDATISNTEETTDITGRNGRKIASLKKNKGVTISATNGLLSCSLLSAQTGKDIEHGTFKVRITDVVKVNTNKATTSKTAVGTLGSEIGVAYVKNTDGTLGEKLEQDATASSGKFAYNPSNNEITTDGIADDTELVLFYDVEVESAKISNDSETYSKVVKLYVDVVCIDNCDREYKAQILIERCSVKGEFELALGGENFAHSFEGESLAGGCTGSTKLWDMIVY